MGLGTLRTQQPKLPTRTGHAGEKLLEKSPNCAVEGREDGEKQVQTEAGEEAASGSEGKPPRFCKFHKNDPS